MLLAGMAGIIVIEIYAAVMQREFQNSDNRTGKGFAVLGIYLFCLTYCGFLFQKLSLLWASINYLLDGLLGSTTWLYGAEVLPMSLRSKVMGIASASHFIVNVGSKFRLTQSSQVPGLTDYIQLPRPAQVLLQTFVRITTTCSLVAQPSFWW